MKTINASEFKAKCLAIIDEVAKTGEPYTILKRGHAVAQVFPPAQTGEAYAQHTLVGTGKITGDIISPPLPADTWDAERGEL